MKEATGVRKRNELVGVDSKAAGRQWQRDRGSSSMSEIRGAAALRDDRQSLRSIFQSSSQRDRTAAADSIGWGCSKMLVELSSAVSRYHTCPR